MSAFGSLVRFAHRFFCSPINFSSEAFAAAAACLPPGRVCLGLVLARVLVRLITEVINSWPFPLLALLGLHLGYVRGFWPSSGLCSWPIKLLGRGSWPSSGLCPWPIKLPIKE